VYQQSLRAKLKLRISVPPAELNGNGRYLSRMRAFSSRETWRIVDVFEVSWTLKPARKARSNANLALVIAIRTNKSLSMSKRNSGLNPPTPRTTSVFQKVQG